MEELPTSKSHPLEASRLQNLEEFLENPAEVLENPVELLENPVELPQNPVELLQIPPELLQFLVEKSSAKFIIFWGLESIFRIIFAIFNLYENASMKQLFFFFTWPKAFRYYKGWMCIIAQDKFKAFKHIHTLVFSAMSSRILHITKRLCTVDF